jgi:hypothetical protein
MGCSLATIPRIVGAPPSVRLTRRLKRRDSRLCDAWMENRRQEALAKPAAAAAPALPEQARRRAGRPRKVTTTTILPAE